MIKQILLFLLILSVSILSAQTKLFEIKDSSENPIFEVSDDHNF